MQKSSISGKQHGRIPISLGPHISLPPRNNILNSLQGKRIPNKRILSTTLIHRRVSEVHQFKLEDHIEFSGRREYVGGKIACLFGLADRDCFVTYNKPKIKTLEKVNPTLGGRTRENALFHFLEVIVNFRATRM
jgi:hypothetical protein